jgi:excisionase family DNA binding protein
MHRRLQFGKRENPASDRRHDSRTEAVSFTNGSYTERASSPPEKLAPSGVHSPADRHKTVNAADRQAATGGMKDETNDNAAAVIQSSPSQRPLHTFEPLIGSCEAARLLGNIHVKTLQRYARYGRVPGYQIGGHWYFRASELDSWLQSRINLSCHPCRLQEESDGT